MTQSPVPMLAENYAPTLSLIQMDGGAANSLQFTSISAAILLQIRLF